MTKKRDQMKEALGAFIDMDSAPEANDKGNISETPQNAQKPPKRASRKKIEKRETRSQRVQLLMKPSLYQAIKEKAKDNDVSFNEYMNFLAERDVEGDY